MSVEKIVRYILLGGVFLIPFIPLIVSSSMFFPFITGKNFTFRILTEILFGLWIILAVYNPRYRPKFSFVLGAMFVFVGIIALADLFGENPFKSFWSNFERMEGLVTFIHLLAYFLIVGAVLNTEKLWHRFWYTSLGVSVLIGGYGILQLAGVYRINQGGVRLDATLGNATYLAVYMLFHIFITVYLLMKWRGATLVRWLFSVIILLQLVILYFTATRGAILGLVGGALLTVLLIALFERQQKKLRTIAIGGVIGIVILVIGFIAIKDTNLVKISDPLARLSSISLEEGSTRFQVWNMAWQGFKERPILGWGQENFNIVFNKFYEPKMYDQEPWFDRVHNIFFDWLIAGGVLGLIAYLLLYATTLYYLWVKRSGDFSVSERSIFTGLLAGYFFHNLFVFDNIVSYILFFSLLAFLHYNFSKEKDPMFTKEVRSGTVSTVVMPVVIIFMIIVVYAFNWNGIATSKTLLQAIAPQPNSPIENLELFKEAIEYKALGRQEVREQALQTASRVSQGEFDDAFKQDFFIVARDAMIEELERTPNDARLLVFMGSIFNTIGQYDNALEYLERAREASPRKQAILFEMATSFINKGERGKAFDVLKEAFELEPKYNLARSLYAVGSIYVGNSKLADELLQEFDISNIAKDGRILGAYIEVGQFDKVVLIWEERIRQDPENSDSHISLAAVYLQVGERTKAVEEIRRSIELDPSFREQGEFFIQEIEAGRNP